MLTVPVIWIPYELHSLYKHIKIVVFIMSWPVILSKLFVKMSNIDLKKWLKNKIFYGCKNYYLSTVGHVM